MIVYVSKVSEWIIPRQFIKNWMEDLTKELKKQKGMKLHKKEITLAFVEDDHMKSLNKQFRGKNKVTDVLSFSGFEDSELGELVLCGAVIDSQAKDNGLKRREELGYLLIHGVLHLLGYEHEKGGQAAKEMFELQDNVFDVLRTKYFY